MSAAMREVRAHWAKLLQPRRQVISLLEFAQGCTLPDGPKAGQRFDPTGHPPQDEFYKAYDSGLYSFFVVIGPTQDGKTWGCVLVPTMYELFILKETVIFALPDENMANAHWQTKIKPAIEASGHSKFLPREGAGSRMGRGGLMKFNNAGVLIFVGGGSKNQSAQAGRTSRRLKEDEIDAMKPEIPPLIERRADSFGSDKRITITSTIKKDRGSNILARYEDSTKGHLEYACPECGCFTRLLWDNVQADYTDDTTARDSIRVKCQHCPKLFDDDQRLVLLQKRKLVMTGNPRSRTWGILWNALESPIREMGELAVMYRNARYMLEAMGDPKEMRQFHRDQLCQPYSGDEVPAELKDENLATNSAMADFKQGMVSAGADFLTAAVDVQLRRLYVHVQGHAKDTREFWVDWWREAICGDMEQPTENQFIAAMDRVRDRLRKGYVTVGSNAIVRPVFHGVDVGYEPDMVRRYLLMRNLKDWIAVRGSSDDRQFQQKAEPRGLMKFEIPGWLEIREKESKTGKNTTTMFVDTDNVKNYVQTGFLRGHALPGSHQLPFGLGRDAEIVRHLTAEVLQETDKGLQWVKVRTRNDYLDTSVYNLALGRYCLANGIGVKKQDFVAKPVADGDGPGFIEQYREGWKDVGTKTWER